MNLRFFLERETDGKLKWICDTLRFGVVPDAIRSYRIRKIEEALTNVELLNKYVLSRLESSAEAILMQWLFHNVKLSNRLSDFFEDHGLLYSDNIPDDVQSILRKIYAKKAIEKLPDLPKTYNPSAFLKFLLFMNLIHNEPMEINKKRGRRRDIQIQSILSKLWLHEDDSWLIEKYIQFLNQKNAIAEGKNKLLLNSSLIDQDKKKELLNLIEFYDWLDRSSYNFAKQLAEIQEKPDDWVHSFALTNLEPMEAIRENVLSTGLVRYVESSSKKFLQLTPEGWLVTKGTVPSYWNDKSVLISADFEAFILHDDNPLQIAVIDHFGSRKSNNHFLVYEINLEELDKRTPGIFGDYNKFKQLLLNRSRYIPDVVRYELES